MKEKYLKQVNESTLNDNGKKLLNKQIEKFYKIKDLDIKINKYDEGDSVKLKKGMLMHGTYKNINGLKKISKEGLITSFNNKRESKYLNIVDVWNLNKDYTLREYINFYSGGTIIYSGLFKSNKNTKKNKTEVIPYNKMNDILEITKGVNSHMWVLEQTKEARFLPSLVQDRVQIGIIMGINKYIHELLKGDILNSKNINDKDVKEFVNPKYYERFIKERKHKDDFFTNRESAILFGIPSNLIEGVLVGRKYEKDIKVLEEIKLLFPKCYICNLDGVVIVGNNN